jgi:hypothetical protein
VEVADNTSDLSKIDIKSLPSGSFPNGISSYPSGSAVFNVKSVVFHSYKVVDSSPNEAFLMMDTLDSQNDIMAEGIEDLQLAYCFGSDDPSKLSNYDLDFAGLNTTGSPIKTIRLVMVSRTSRPDPYGKTFARIAALNHTAVGAPDNYPRRFLESSVQLRNY